MNILLHFFLNYLIIDLVFGNAWTYAPIIFIFSLLIDLDHIPYTLRTGRSLAKKRFGSESRTRFHEMYGLALTSILMSVFYLFLETALVQIIALCLVLHFASDFFLGKTRPFYPVSGKEVFLGFCEQKYRIPLEAVLTLILGGLVWVSVASLVL